MWRDPANADDELHSSAFISDATYAHLASMFNPAQLIELVMTVGQYTMLSMVANSFEVAMEPGLEPLLGEEEGHAREHTDEIQHGPLFAWLRDITSDDAKGPRMGKSVASRPRPPRGGRVRSEHRNATEVA